MIGTLDRALGRVPMYRLVWMTLAALLLLAVGYAAAGLLFSTPVELVASTAVAVASTTLASVALARAFGTRAHVESSLVTGLLLACLLFPTADPRGLAVIALVGAIAAASKFVLVWRGRHLFNPAAVAVLIISFTQLTAGVWWIASGVLWPWVLLGSLLVVARVRRWSIVLVYVGVAGAVSVGRLVTSGQDLGGALALVLTAYPFVFAAAFFLTEPLTLAPRRPQQLIIAVVAALLASVPFTLGPIHASPELGLVVGNVLAFAVSRRRRLSLALTSSSELAPGIREYRFRPDPPVRFEPGQWIELDLPHRADRRGRRRTFSIASAPADGEIAVALRLPEKASSFKRELDSLEPGAVVRATGVGGDFVLPRDPSTPLLLVAGGIGITPFASQLRSLADGPRRDVVVVCAARRLEEVAYRELLLRSGARVVLVSREAPESLPEGWSRLEGRLTAHSIREAVPDAPRRAAFVSGSPEFVDSVRGALRAAGATRIRTDAFAGY